MQVIKKDGTLETYNEQKIINACSLAANRALINFSDEDYTTICNKVLNVIDEENYFEEEFQEDIIPVSDMHVIVEKVLMELYPSVGESYRQYRNYKQDFVKMLNEVYTKEQEQRYIGDVSNANTDSTMVSTQRSLSYGLLSKELYKHFFLTKEEMQASNDGYIYIHDMKDRRDGINCCLFNMSNVLNNGFEMGNVWYNEPKTLDVAFDVIGDVTFGASAQQYGGFTIPQIDKILAPYAEKSYQKYKKEFYEIKGLIEDVDGVYLDCMSNITFDSQADKYATEKVRKEFEQGFQGWEYKFNTVGSSRGDYPFIAISFGIGTSKWETMASEMALKVRMNGQGKEGFKRPVLFPKLTFLYDDNLHGEGKEFEWLFDLACQCSSKTMYPDFLSLSGEGYIPSMYKKYGKVVSLMGCRASLSPWYERGGMHPADEDDVPVFEGRFNLGAIS